MKCLKMLSAFLTILSTNITMAYRLTLAPNGKLDFVWHVDYERSEIEIELKAKLEKNEWMFVGFSDRGEVQKADLILVYHDFRHRLRFRDAYTDDLGILHIDQRQNCHVEYSSQYWSRDLIRVKLVRNIDTCDPRDYQFDNGTTHILYGFSQFLPVPGYTNLTELKPRVQWAQILKPVIKAPPMPRDVYTVDMTLPNVKVPGLETTYWCHVVKLPKMARKQHVIRFEAIVTPGNEHLVHHMELFHCEVPSHVRVPDYSGPCPEEGSQMSDHSELLLIRRCKRVIAAWAMGAPPMIYPEETGIPVGGPDFSPYTMIQVHFNNPDREKGVMDSSGIRFYVSPRLRPHDAGIMEIGLEYTDKMAIPPGQKEFLLNGSCISECTRVGLPPKGIMIFASQLHTHLTGIGVVIRHIRNGVELPQLNRDDHFTQMYQEIRTLPEQRKLVPGDALEIQCIYRTLDRHNVTLGGFAITDEMCVSYLHYYPKMKLEVCKSSIAFKPLFKFFREMNMYDMDPTSQHSAISTNYKAIRWTPMTSQILADTYSQSGLSMQCNKSSGTRFPGLWENMPRPMILEPLNPPEDDDSCP